MSSPEEKMEVLVKLAECWKFKPDLSLTDTLYLIKCETDKDIWDLDDPEFLEATNLRIERKMKDEYN